MRLIIHTDGGSRNNPGHAATGYVICDERGHVLAAEGRYIGIQTNNVAEYTALLHSLQMAQELTMQNQVDAIDCLLDSNLIVQQMNGKFKIKAQHLLPIIDEIRALIRALPPITFTHVYREQNKQADALVNQALDKAMGMS